MLTAGGASMTVRDVARSHAGLGLENPGKAIQFPVSACQAGEASECSVWIEWTGHLPVR